MPVTDKQVQDFEKSHKEQLFRTVDHLCDQHAKLISSLEKLCTSLGIQGDFYNTGFAINNKINELSQQFKQAGTSIFSSKIEDYGTLNINMVSTSFIGDAIANTLFDIAEKDVNLSANLVVSLESLDKQQQSLQKSSPIRNFFSKLRSFVMPLQKTPQSYIEQYKEAFSSYQTQHNEMTNQIFNYTLEENLVSSLVSYISKKGHLQSDIQRSIRGMYYSRFRKIRVDTFASSIK